MTAISVGNCPLPSDYRPFNINEREMCNARRWAEYGRKCLCIHANYKTNSDGQKIDYCKVFDSGIWMRVYYNDNRLYVRKFYLSQQSVFQTLRPCISSK
jgi:hypothetical protein